jgi:hypothetical protein
MKPGREHNYLDVKDHPEAHDANQEAHRFVEECGAEIWKNISGPMLEDIAQAISEKLQPEMAVHFKHSPILRIVFYAGLSNGYTNALLIDKQKRVAMAKIRESN